MLIYHTHCDTGSNGGYKSVVNRGEQVNQSKVLNPVGRKKFKRSKNKKISNKNKKISNKNKKFLEGLGLKVKQSIENC